MIDMGERLGYKTGKLALTPAASKGNKMTKQEGEILAKIKAPVKNSGTEQNGWLVQWLEGKTCLVFIRWEVNLRSRREDFRRPVFKEWYKRHTETRNVNSLVPDPPKRRASR